MSELKAFDIVEKYGKENAELKAEIESLKASHYAESVDESMENRKLKRAFFEIMEEFWEKD